MLREIAIRRALEDARSRRQHELDEVQERARGLRRRLRETTDRLLALGVVRERFGAATPSPAPKAEEPRHEPAVETPVAPAVTAGPAFTLTPPRPDDTHTKLIAVLLDRHREGFTVGQMRDVLDEVDAGRPHTYDAAWALANAFVRNRAIEIAGTRPGPAGPIRVFRVPGAPGADGSDLPTGAR